jgi:RNA polymerase sigma factor (sigma-70 family)
VWYNIHQGGKQRMSDKYIVPLTEEQKELVEKNHNLIYDFAHKRNILNIDDWYGILATALCKAAKGYDESKGYAFTTFTFRCMDNELNDVLRKYNSSINKDALYYDDDSFQEEFIDSRQHKAMQYDIMLNSLINRLNDNEAKTILMVADGFTQSEIAENIGCKQQNISHYIKQIKKKIGHWLID